MLKLNFKFLAVIIASSLILAAPAISLADDALMSKIQAHYQKVNSLSGEFEQVLLHKESGSRTEQAGKLSFSKPLLVRWEVTTPNREELIVVNAAAVWNYIPGEEIVYKYSVDLVQDSRTMIKVITGQADLREDFRVRSDGREDGLSKLRLIPKEATQQITMAAIWVSDEGVIRRAMIQDFFGNENEITFTSLDFDVPMQDSMFQFTPPANVELEDRSGEGVGQPQERKLFQ
jgi:outer membrane lipoprotein carrier protein